MNTPSSDRALRDVLLAWDTVADAWGLSDAERGSLMPGGLTGPVCDADSWRTDVAEHRIRLLVTIGELAAEVHKAPDRLRWWLRRPNPALADRPPLEVMAESVAWMEWLVRSLQASL